MPAELRLCHRSKPDVSITVAQLISLLSAERLEERDRRVRVMRETFECPATVKDDKEYRTELFRFYGHYHEFFWGKLEPESYARDSSWEHLERWYRKPLWRAERNSILGRDGGFIKVINEITEGLAQQMVKNYVEGVLFDYLPQDLDLKQRLAHELLDNYAHVLFPNEAQITPWFLIVGQIDDVLRTFALNLHTIWRQFRF